LGQLGGWGGKGGEGWLGDATTSSAVSQRFATGGEGVEFGSTLKKINPRTGGGKTQDIAIIGRKKKDGKWVIYFGPANRARQKKGEKEKGVP